MFGANQLGLREEAAPPGCHPVRRRKKKVPADNDAFNRSTASYYTICQEGISMGMAATDWRTIASCDGRTAFGCFQPSVGPRVRRQESNEEARPRRHFTTRPSLLLQAAPPPPPAAASSPAAAAPPPAAPPPVPPPPPPPPPPPAAQEGDSKSPWRPWKSAREHATPPPPPEEPEPEPEPEPPRDTEQRIKNAPVQRRPPEPPPGPPKPSPPVGRSPKPTRPPTPYRHSAKSQPNVYWKREKTEKDHGDLIIKHPEGEEYLLKVPLGYDPGEEEEQDSPAVRFLKMVVGLIILGLFIGSVVYLIQRSALLENSPEGMASPVYKAKEFIIVVLLALFLLVFVLSGIGKGPGDA